MNCYSCPGAVAACPIGALQATIGSYEYKFAFYVAGFMILVGTFMGRFVCGWLCPFCKYICPLGAIYSLFNPVSILRYRVDSEKCVNCGACAKACKMGCDPVKNANSLECIRCGKCKNICPTHAIGYCAFSRSLRKKNKT